MKSKVHIMRSLRLRLISIADANRRQEAALKEYRKTRRCLILEAYMEGMPIKEISKLVGWSTEKVRQVIGKESRNHDKH